MNPSTVAILGGGCAGLSLARELVRAEAAGQALPEVHVLEPRDRYTEDRTWCFWARGEAARNPLIRHRWPAWQFSRGSEACRHTAPGWSYCCVPAGGFYKEACTAIRESSRVHLRHGTVVDDVHEAGHTLKVVSSAGTLKADAVIDTRPPPPGESAPILLQGFTGAVVEDPRPDADRTTAGLMDAMETDEYGFRFDYVLPLDAGRVLVEATRFTPDPLPPAVLDADLDRALHRVLGTTAPRVLRREHGTLPMGLPAPPPPRHPARVYAGTRGGAVRAASGYAFQRIQQWAKSCAQSIVEKGTPIGHPPEPTIRRCMDRLFLSVLRDHPETGPDLFLRLARGTPPEVLVRFLSDRAGLHDAGTVIRTLPASLFLRQWSANLLVHREQAV